jgi:predicted dehydrogenase
MSLVMRVAIVGRTGAGGYGHSLDQAFVANPRAEIVAVSDPDEAGRAACMGRTGAPRGYPDHRQMLEAERPDVVTVAPRHVDCHPRMVGDALRSGAHVYCEKPFTQTLDQADGLIDLADARGLKVAVALPFVHEPRARVLDEIRAGAIGRVRSMRAICKCDHRGGGQDFIVLGTHFADMMRRIAGDPLRCSATVLAGGRPARRTDAVDGEEGVGPVAGDGILAVYEFAGGVVGSIESWRLGIEDRARHPYRLEVCGTGGTFVIRAPYADHSVLYSPDPFGRPGGASWTAVPTDPVPTYGDYHRPGADDLLDAIEQDREPACSGRDGRAALEMILAAYRAHLDGPVPLPLVDRGHPLAAAR